MKRVPELTVINILLADDDTDDCLFFEKVLKEISIKTNLSIVNDGEQVVAYLLKNMAKLPDVIFLDLNMPRKNGFECLTEIKENKKLKDVPVIIFSTAYPRDLNYEQDMVKMLFELGALDFIRKSENFTELKQSITRILTLIIEKKA